MKKSILESALVHLLNNNEEKAAELMHKFIVDSARNINESLREGEEFDDDLEDVEAADDAELFSEDDLGEDEAAVEVADDLGVEDEETAMDVEVDMDDELEADPDADVGSTDVADLAAELDELQARFNEVIAELGIDDDDDGDVVVDEDDESYDDEDGFDEGAEYAEVDVDAALSDEEFDDITESVLDELKAVKPNNKEGVGSDGSEIKVQRRSAVTGQHGKAAPSSSKGAGHKGFDRETAPKVDALRGGKTVANKSVNTRSKGAAGKEKVTPRNKALLNQDKSNKSKSGFRK